MTNYTECEHQRKIERLDEKDTYIVPKIQFEKEAEVNKVIEVSQDDIDWPLDMILPTFQRKDTSCYYQLNTLKIHNDFTNNNIIVQLGNNSLSIDVNDYINAVSCRIYTDEVYNKNKKIMTDCKNNIKKDIKDFIKQTPNWGFNSNL